MKPRHRDCTSRLLVETEVSQRLTGVTLLAVTVTALGRLDTTIGVVTEILANAEYYSAANLTLCAEAVVVPYIPNRRERHAGGLLHFQEPAPNTSIDEPT